MFGANNRSEHFFIIPFVFIIVRVFCVVTVFVRLVSLSNHKNMRQRFLLCLIFYRTMTPNGVGWQPLRGYFLN